LSAVRARHATAPTKGSGKPRAANERVAAAQVVLAVARNGRSLDTALSAALAGLEVLRRPLARALACGTVRWYLRLEALLAQMLSKPLRDRDADVRCLLLVGLYQLIHMRVPLHAAVSETVAAASTMGKPWAGALVNAVLRRFLSQRERLLAAVDRRPENRTAQPTWLFDRIQAAWPDRAESILSASNEQPPMTLRVAAHRVSREAYLEMLRAAGLDARAPAEAPQAVELLRPVDVRALPGFDEGLVSVQDGAAQFAAKLLGAQAGERVLDACAAPGGKTCHILELEPDLAQIWALDRDPGRLLRVEENLERLGLQAHVMRADAREPERWWDGERFDRILLDAPCSATGVMRRHPDVKLLRRPADVPALAQQQRRLLDTLWDLLKPGGHVLYVTCSILPEENHEQVLGFMRSHDDAREVPLRVRWGQACPVGRQILPGDDRMDGLYYAHMEKR
jgi:16S rRNA (cytosine967-C5)-methyltransferase